MTAKSERTFQVLIGVLLVALSLVVAKAFQEKIINAGDTAPGFTITTDSGRQISPADFGGRVLVLNFWATWCPPCVEELPSLNEFHRQLAGSGVVVVGVSIDKNEKIYRDFLKRARITFETARDPEANISSDYGTFKVPETYIIDRTGTVVEKLINLQDWTDPNLVARVKRLL
jgi:cytochrome c biogenesis protein CcmG, thiol:disulfide interchange protein DsbE